MDNLSQFYSCKIQGCDIGFANEDLLTIHEKTHCMTLNLDSENKLLNGFIGDQTPTPTKLIKNCEEVGLFDDLKHVNPFDETFRRAVEFKKNNNDNTTNLINDLKNKSLTENKNNSINHNDNNNDNNNNNNNNNNNHNNASNNCLLINEESLHTPQVIQTIDFYESQHLQKRQEEQNQQDHNQNDNEQKNKLSELQDIKTNLNLNNSIDKKHENQNIKNFKIKKHNNCSYKNNKNIKVQQPLTCNENENQIFISSMEALTPTKSFVLPIQPIITIPQFVTIKVLPEGAVLPSKPILLPKPNTEIKILQIQQTENQSQTQNISTDIIQLNPFESQVIDRKTIKDKLKELVSQKSNFNQSTNLLLNTENKKMTNISINKINNNNCRKTEDSRKEKISASERKKAAALRYRKKIKKQRFELEETNKRLKLENNNLKLENNKLKIAIKELQNLLSNNMKK